MAKKDHVSETPATQLLKAHQVSFTEHPYDYLEHGGALHSAEVLGFGLLTGKYDVTGTDGPDAPHGARIARYESVRKQRWGRPEALAAARRYNALAHENGLTPTQLALAFCYTKWQVASTIIGVTSVAQLGEDLDAFGTTLSAEVLAEIDRIRWEIRDPAL